MTEEKIDVVDEQDRIIGILPKSKIMDDAITHRGVYVMLLNLDDEVFVHQRAFRKKSYPDYWDMFVGGFVSSGEDYNTAARRELKEETRIIANGIDFISKFRYKTKEDDWFGRLYKYATNQEPVIQEEEIEQAFYLPIEQLEDFIKQRKVKPSSLYVYENYRHEINEKVKNIRSF